MPLVVALGFLNIFLIFVFRTAGGMDFKPPRQPLEPRAQQTMGRRAGRFRDSAPSTSTTDEYGEPPLVILVLELFPWLCKLLMPLLLVYSAIFFSSRVRERSTTPSKTVASFDETTFASVARKTHSRFPFKRRKNSDAREVNKR